MVAETGFVSKCAAGRAGSEEKIKTNPLVELAKDMRASSLGKKIGELDKKASVDIELRRGSWTR